MKHRATLAVGLLAVVLVPAAWAQDNEAEKLFCEMEKKLRGAKTLEVVFTYQLEGKTTKGSLLLTNDNKARLQVSGRFSFGARRDASIELVSDGKKLKLKGARVVGGPTGKAGFELGGQMEWETPKAFHAWHAAEVSRVGMEPMVLALPYTLGAEIDPDGEETRMAVSDFKAGTVEKVRERQATVVHYRCGKGGNDDPKVTLWIDAETGLPLKRVYIAHPESEKIASSRITTTSSLMRRSMPRLLSYRSREKRGRPEIHIRR
jgi:outer membrane lipoprotein-sorting protein